MRSIWARTERCNAVLVCKALHAEALAGFYSRTRFRLSQSDIDDKQWWPKWLDDSSAGAQVARRSRINHIRLLRVDVRDAPSLCQVISWLEGVRPDTALKLEVGCGLFSVAPREAERMRVALMALSEKRQDIRVVPVSAKLHFARPPSSESGRIKKDAHVAET